MATKILTVKGIESLQAKDKNYFVNDGDGLYLLVTAKGSKRWIYKYSFQNKKETLAIGVYPKISLAKAREAHAKAKLLKDSGINPVEKKRDDKKQELQSLNDIFNEWYKLTAKDRAETTNERTIRAYEKDLAPWIGNEPIKSIKKGAVIECLKRVDSRTGGESARRLKMLCNQIWRYAVNCDYCEHNIIADIDSKTVLQKAEKKHMAHITDTAELSRLLKDIDFYKGHFITICALKIAMLLIVRPLNIRLMRWGEIDFESKLWIIPAQKNPDGSRREGYQNRMKKNRPHAVPLSIQAIAILNEIRPLTGISEFVFHTSRGANIKPLSENTLNGALSNMGYKNQTMHGIRHTASTILNESGLFRPDVIETALAHNDKNSIRQTYNKAEYIEERKELMQWWANLLDNFKRGEE